MALGEFDFEDHFIYDKVDEFRGSNYSTQIMFLMFIVYGSMIILNLITAWIVVNQRDANSEIILESKRIEEICGMTKIFPGTRCSKSNESSLNVPPTLLVIPVKKETKGCKGRLRYSISPMKMRSL